MEVRMAGDLAAGGAAPDPSGVLGSGFRGEDWREKGLAGRSMEGESEVDAFSVGSWMVSVSEGGRRCLEGVAVLEGCLVWGVVRRSQV